MFHTIACYLRCLQWPMRRVRMNTGLNAFSGRRCTCLLAPSLVVAYHSPALGGDIYRRTISPSSSITVASSMGLFGSSGLARINVGTNSSLLGLFRLIRDEFFFLFTEHLFLYGFILFNDSRLFWYGNRRCSNFVK